MLTVVFFFYYLKNLVSIHVNMHRCVMDGVQMVLLEWGGGGGRGGTERVGVGWVGGVCVVVCCPAVASGFRGTLLYSLH